MFDEIPGMTEPKRGRRRSPRAIPMEMVEQARRLRLTGKSFDRIADILGIAPSTVGKYTADLGVDTRGAANVARAAEPPEWFSGARTLLASGLTKNQIAAELNVAKSSVYRMFEKFGP